ncbi:MAG: sensor domain-containing diguanylate cyclase [Nitrospirae bacterium]|nr:sensor domain-containing diguanylate cyclase [Nitrospirota bacterium]
MSKVAVVITLSLFLISSTIAQGGSANGKTIVFTQPSSSPPFAYSDEAGQPRGIVIDYWNLWALRNNIKIQFVLEEFQDSLQKVKDGKAEVIAGILQSEEREKYLEFSDGFIDLKICLYVPQGIETKKLQDLKSLSIAIIRGHAAIDYIKNSYPHFNIVLFNNYEEMFKSLSDNETVFVSDYYTAKHYMTQNGSLGKYKFVKTLFNGSLRAAVRRGNTDMLALINDGMQKIDRGDIEKIYNAWFDHSPKFPDWLSKLVVGAGFSALILGLLSYIFVLRVQLKRKTTSLEDALERIKKKDETLDLLSRTDPLTGLSNRLDMYDKFKYHQSIFKRYGRCFSIVLCSIDDLKEFNAAYDMECGLKMIVEAANRLRVSLRRQDFVGRWSMEEFILLLPETDLDGGSKIAEKLRKEIQGRKFIYKGKEIPATMTFGVSVYDAGMPIDDCIKQADECLYIGKKSGSNMVVAFKP